MVDNDRAKVTITLELEEHDAAAIFHARDKMQRGKPRGVGVSEACALLAKEYCDRPNVDAQSRGVTSGEVGLAHGIRALGARALAGATEGTLYGGDPATNGSIGAPIK